MEKKSGNQSDKRLTLMGKNMPDWVYERLSEKRDRKELTAYVTSLVEREEQFNQLLAHLSNLALLPAMSVKLDQLVSGGVVAPVQPMVPLQQVQEEEAEVESIEDKVHEGDIEISENVESVGVDEDDFGSPTYNF
ncbi:hypothetical protein CN495_08080 [Bacillus thuringiensis]|uniref:Uncharacterized protein n=1 Tax=Bacillus thuringiensis TaxID=1428 RepID=A0ABD6S886_BACTU|nr:hypothetical protein [Bacillus thuringiensis]PER55701.1 hypothetical protein CN495_08080 [Bacillus thuringiensis]